MGHPKYVGFRWVQLECQISCHEVKSIKTDRYQTQTLNIKPRLNQLRVTVSKILEKRIRLYVQVNQLIKVNQLIRGTFPATISHNLGNM